MNTETIRQIVGWRWDLYHIGIAVAIIGRVYHAAGGWSGITTRGGIVGIVRALLFGTNTPKPDNSPKP